MQWHHNCFENYTTSVNPLSQTSSFESVTNEEEKTKKSHFFVYSRRATHDSHHTLYGDRGGTVCPIFAPPNFFEPISCFAVRGYWKSVRKCKVKSGGNRWRSYYYKLLPSLLVKEFWKSVGGSVLSKVMDRSIIYGFSIDSRVTGVTAFASSSDKNESEIQ